MGASILPVTIYKGKLYFLFGKERTIDSNPGWSDFGGGTDAKETYIQTAIREGGEELTGFLGSDSDVKKLLTRFGTFDIDFASTGFGLYRVHRFLQKRLNPKIIKDTKIFEKQEIKWICVDDIKGMKKEFRSFYQNIVELILAKQLEIDTFIRRSLKKTRSNKSRKTNKRRKSKSRKHGR